MKQMFDSITASLFTRFAQLQKREQWLIGLLAVLCLIMLYGTIIWQPIHRWYDVSLRELRIRYNQSHLLDTHHDAIASSVSMMQQQDASDATLLEKLLQTARAEQIDIATFNVQSDDGLLVRFANVPLEPLLQLIHVLEKRHDIIVEDVALLMRQGTVDATITVRNI